MSLHTFLGWASLSQQDLGLQIHLHFTYTEWRTLHLMLSGLRAPT